MPQAKFADPPPGVPLEERRYPPEWYCPGRSKQRRLPSGELARCGRRAGWGTDHLGVGACAAHGGTSVNHRRKASVELARKEVAALGLGEGESAADRQVSPAQVLLNALWSAHDDMRLYGWLVQELELHPEGQTAETVGLNGALYGETFHLTGKGTGEAKRHVLVQLYEDAQKRAADIAAACLRAKVAEAQLKVAQDRASAFADAQRSLVLALGHSPADPNVRKAMRASLALAITAA